MIANQISNTTCHCLKIRRGAAAVVDFYDKILKPSGVTVRQYSLLHAINEHEGCNLRGLSEVTELDRSTLTRSLKPLFTQEFIINAKKDSQRDSRLILTAKGFRTLQQAAELWQKAQSDFEAKVGTERLETLEEILAAIQS
ncbi:MAG: MarR family transcriptional regulator [Selenomonadaceae bacterium]|nr:MarR family transcriptional regulator [Selenomonadaceae bacterium]